MHCDQTDAEPRVMRVADLERELASRVPPALAEEWDCVGLVAGDPAAAVTGVLVTLDATAEACERALVLGANVIVSHHPPYLEAPLHVLPAPGPAGTVASALRLGVSVICLHTNLDRSPEGASALPRALGLRILAPLESTMTASSPADDPTSPGFGRLCETEDAETVDDLARRVSGTLGVAVRVWGDGTAPGGRVAVANGSPGPLLAEALAASHTLVTGEVRYHECVAAVSAGLAIIEAGHDATEWPIVAVLADVVGDCVPASLPVHAERPHTAWRTVEESNA